MVEQVAEVRRQKYELHLGLGNAVVRVSAAARWMWCLHSAFPQISAWL